MTELNLTAPRSWKELSAKQLTYISWLMTQKQLSPEELHAFAFVRFTGIRIVHEKDGYCLCRHKGRFFTLSPEQILSFSRQFAWLTSGIGEITPIPELNGYRHQDCRLRGLPFAQYLACENYYQAYIFTKDEIFLNCLIASFYLSEEKFDDGKTAEFSKTFAKIPFHIRHTVFLWFYGLKSVFQENFPNFFQKIETILEDEKPQAPNMRKQIDNMIRTLTGGDVTKTKAIYTVDTWAALAELDAKALEYKELERRIKKKQ
jgi:hypothetical protein